MCIRARLVREAGISQSNDRRQRRGTVDESWKRPEGPFFTGVGGCKEPERVKSRLGSAGAPPLGVEIQSAAKLPRRLSPGRLTELINF